MRESLRVSVNIYLSIDQHLIPENLLKCWDVITRCFTQPMVSISCWSKISIVFFFWVDFFFSFPFSPHFLIQDFSGYILVKDKLRAAGHSDLHVDQKIILNVFCSVAHLLMIHRFGERRLFIHSINSVTYWWTNRGSSKGLFIWYV